MLTTAWTRKLRLCAIAVLVFGFASTSVRGGSPVFVGRKATQQLSMDQFDHAAWDELLKKYVNKDGMVDYRGLKSNADDMNRLRRYLDSLSAANPSVTASRGAKLAFWINAYNAVTLHGILREYPTTSIRNHTPRLFGYHIWHDLQLYVGGTAYSLDTIEHQILRKMGEPRIHFAIVCASIGCPRLLNEAYRANRVDQQLETNAKDFFARSQNFRYDQSQQRFFLSSILDWFGDDFGGSQAEQLRRISQWLPSAAAQSAARQNAVRVSYLNYNWDLNQQ